jgi:hypothetical protein
LHGSLPAWVPAGLNSQQAGLKFMITNQLPAQQNSAAQNCGAAAKSDDLALAEISKIATMSQGFDDLKPPDKNWPQA